MNFIVDKRGNGIILRSGNSEGGKIKFRGNRLKMEKPKALSIQKLIDAP